MRSMILLATPSSERLADWQHGLAMFAPVATAREPASLERAMTEGAPGVLLLDLDMHGLAAPDRIAALKQLSPDTAIVAVSGPIADDDELALFMSGVRGCCSYDIGGELLVRLIVAVARGELWIRRSLTPRLLEELAARSRGEAPPKRRVNRTLAHLTQREREIATLIGSGNTNKEIARQLAITERTVKAHLTGIFRKLGIADRLKLALQVTDRMEPEREHAS
jgi:two-component system NarL family response regulator